MAEIQTFGGALKKSGLHLQRRSTEIVQVNIGRKCNQACHHCHVEASPVRTENMESRTLERLLAVIRASPKIKTVDITGGAPEMNPHFRSLVTEVRSLGISVIDRCNLTVFFEKGQEDTAEFLGANSVHVVASLPCYSKENVERQRGRGVFSKSVEALNVLNRMGYGRMNSGLVLDLVYNPTGPFLPPDQARLEADYRRELKELFDIDFNHLYTITNMPIKRFLFDLEKTGKLDAYMDLLVNSFNPGAAENIMCRNLVSVAWDGGLYDCDFNQMLELSLGAGKKSIWDIHSFAELDERSISFGQHCFACTAGSGSSCGGALV